MQFKTNQSTHHVYKLQILPKYWCFKNIFFTLARSYTETKTLRTFHKPQVTMMIFQDRFCTVPCFHSAWIWATVHHVHVSYLTHTHTPSPTFPTMQGQTLSSEAHWDIFQNSSSTSCCPSAHTHTWLAAMDMVSMPHCLQRPSPLWIEQEGGLWAITQSERQTRLRWLKDDI